MSTTEVFYAALLAIAAFWLSACPFSLWLGRWFLGKDIRRYGDGNPGAANVFRAGGRKLGFTAVLLDIAKGVPLVMLAKLYFAHSEPTLVVVALCAVLGHAFSPLLRFRGGKSVAVTFGVIIGLLQPEMLFVFTAFVVFGSLFVEGDSWTVMLGPAGTLPYLLLSQGLTWQAVFMLGVLTLFVLKQFEELKTAPRLKMKPLNWLQSRRQRT